MTTDELLGHVRQYALEHFPRVAAVRFTVAPPGASEPHVSVLVDLTARPAPAARGPAVGRVDRALLAAVTGLEVESPTGPEIADAAHFPNGPELRKRLSALRKRGLLGGRERDQGYPITPAGLEALDQAGDL